MRADTFQLVATPAGDAYKANFPESVDIKRYSGWLKVFGGLRQLVAYQVQKISHS